MRLVCPNCDAEYEVDAAVIPSAGRDVQCSNCGNAWFQPSPTVEAAHAEEAALFDAPVHEDGAAAEPEVSAQPRGLDETVVAVLREEAEREAAARRAEASQPIETQTELSLTPAPVPFVNPATQRIARLKGIEAEPRPAPRPQTRREMLPAIEEINSTLRAASERRTGEAATVTDSLPARSTGAGGFRSGFVLMLVLAAAALAVYAMAPAIAEQSPGLAPSLAGYVGAVDSLRLWLDDVMQQAVSGLRGLAGNPSP